LSVAGVVVIPNLSPLGKHWWRRDSINLDFLNVSSLTHKLGYSIFYQKINIFVKIFISILGGELGFLIRYRYSIDN
jgi:hypothetical protein